MVGGYVPIMSIIIVAVATNKYWVVGLAQMRCMTNLS
jgi:hypothetical protein